MAQTHDFGPLFFTTLDLVPGPLLHSGWSQEVEPPFRASRVIVIRLPFLNKGLALGWWRKTGMDEEEALLAAMSGYGLDLYDADLDDPGVRQKIRENIAQHADDVDDEWTIMQAMGVFD